MWPFDLIYNPFERLYKRMEILIMATSEELLAKLQALAVQVTDTKAVVDKVSGETTKLLEMLNDGDDIPQEIMDQVAVVESAMSELQASAAAVDAKVPD